MKLLSRLLGRPIESLVRLACFLALFGLLVLCVSIVWPKPIPVIFAMSGGHLIGILAFACYLLAIVLDLRRAERPRRDAEDAEEKDTPLPPPI